MTQTALGSGTIYTETVVWAPPEAYVNDAPYQLAIVVLDDGGRVTSRIIGDRVQIGDRVDFVEHRNGAPYFKKRLLNKSLQPPKALEQPVLTGTLA